MLAPRLSEADLSFLRADGRAADWARSEGLVDYGEAVRFMEARAAEVAAKSAAELVWLLEHPPLYTAGVSARAADLLQPDRFPVHRSARGGQLTYHGPGQRVVYVVLDLTERRRDVHAFVAALERLVAETLLAFDLEGGTRPGRVGIWVPRPGQGEGGPEDKIAAFGVKIRKWVSFHGLSLNVDPDLEHFSGIVPCGLREHGVTSLAAQGRKASMDEVDQALKRSFETIFGRVREVGAPSL